MMANKDKKLNKIEEGLSVFTVLIENELCKTGFRVRAINREEAEILADKLLLEDVNEARKHPKVISIWHVEERDDW